MRPTLQYVIEKFDYYNRLCFKGELPRPVIRLNTRHRAKGMAKCRQTIDANGVMRNMDFCIEISVREDLPEEDYIGIIVHEMIHYYIQYNNLPDDSPHGTLFQKIMNRIIKSFGIKVTITYKPTEETLMRNKSYWRYICVIRDNKDQVFVAVVARNKILEFWSELNRSEYLTSVRWYISNCRYFDKFPTSVNLRFVKIERDILSHYLAEAKELEYDGHEITMK